MRSRHIQEMSCWPQRPDPDEDDFGLLKALVVGVPVGLLPGGWCHGCCDQVSDRAHPQARAAAGQSRAGDRRVDDVLVGRMAACGGGADEAAPMTDRPWIVALWLIGAALVGSAAQAYVRYFGWL